MIGSGPYTLEDYKPEGHADLAKNATYKGPAKVGNNAVSIQYFKDSGTMVEALKKEEIDVTFRGLAAEDVVASTGRTARRASSWSRRPAPRSATSSSTRRTPGPRTRPSARPSPRPWTAAR